MQLIVHAPNVHTGGGLRLLMSFITSSSRLVKWGHIDARVSRAGLSPSTIKVYWVDRNVRGRLRAEWRLWRMTRREEVILCFHGLPPLLPVRGRVVVFVQNRLLIERNSLAAYPIKVRARLWVERLWAWALQGRCSRYIVQTPSMAESVRRWQWREVPVSVLPFAPAAPSTPAVALDTPVQRFDFVYVASGEAHKNHRTLLEAWRLLADAGVRPSLGLTLDGHAHAALCEHVAQFAATHGLAVANLGVLSGQSVDTLYRSAGAMIYPSTCESLGLPLVEAAQRGLPILAPELDYVRDVVEPVETFDPNSPVSIARAVRRFLGVPDAPLKIATPAAFLAEVLR